MLNSLHSKFIQSTTLAMLANKICGRTNFLKHATSFHKFSTLNLSFSSPSPKIREFSSIPPPSPPSPSPSPSPKTKTGLLGKILTPKVQNYFFAASSVGGTLLVAKLAMNFTSFFTHLTPQLVGKWGFYTGFGTASVMGALGLFTIDALTIRADPVFKHCLSKVQVDPEAMRMLGDGITPGKLRSYRLDAAKFEPTSNKTAKWREPRVQMIFDVIGTGPPYRPAIVTCEAVKSSFSFPPKLTTTVLKVDFETGNGEEGGIEGDQTIWLRGDREKFERVSNRSGLSLNCLANNMHINRAATK